MPSAFSVSFSDLVNDLVSDLTTKLPDCEEVLKERQAAEKKAAYLAAIETWKANYGKSDESGAKAADEAVFILMENGGHDHIATAIIKDPSLFMRPNRLHTFITGESSKPRVDEHGNKVIENGRPVYDPVNYPKATAGLASRVADAVSKVAMARYRATAGPEFYRVGPNFWQQSSAEKDPLYEAKGVVASAMATILQLMKSMGDKENFDKVVKHFIDRFGYGCLPSTAHGIIMNARGNGNRNNGQNTVVDGNGTAVRGRKPGRSKSNGSVVRTEEPAPAMPSLAGELSKLHTPEDDDAAAETEETQAVVN